MPVSKVVYGDNTLIDLTSDTVTAETLVEGITAHGADGNMIIGALAMALKCEQLGWGHSASRNVTTSVTAPEDGYYLLYGMSSCADNSVGTTLTYTGADVIYSNTYNGGGSNHIQVKVALVYQTQGGTLSVKCTSNSSGNYPRTSRFIGRLYLDSGDNA